ncbi:MAG: ribonuclease H family protein [Bacteroidales bacterium]|nr:ribonuclease H family protein [Bacteroidales bacterium]
MANSKYYVVWEGFAPGVYDSWEECRQQIEGYKNAKYKSFSTKEKAVDAFRADYSEHIGILDGVAKALSATAPVKSNYIIESLAVDAACSGNPGKMEYRGVYVRTGEEIFRIGPLDDGTNNIGEFLAIVHGISLLKQKNILLPIYSDSVNAMLWVKNKKCRTKLEKTPRNQKIFEMIERAEKWLENNTYSTKIMKWETKQWGEIPADFGRKK